MLSSVKDVDSYDKPWHRLRGNYTPPEILAMAALRQTEIAR
jgi:hypothetical protein